MQRSSKTFFHKLANGEQPAWNSIPEYFAQTDYKPQGFVLDIHQVGSPVAKKIKQPGYEIILDPCTHKLSTAGPKTIKQIGLSQEELEAGTQDRIANALEKQREKHSSVLILPYLAEKDSGRLADWHKGVWSNIQRGELIEESEKLYAGVVVPLSILKDKAEVSRFTNALQGSYGLDGFYLKFQYLDPRKKSFETYAGNMRLVVEFFRNMGDVVIGNATAYHLLLCPAESLAFGLHGPQKEFNPRSKNTGGDSRHQRKMAYYCDALFTFVGDDFRALVANNENLKDSLQCSSAVGEELKPFDNGGQNIELEMKHYMEKIVQQHRTFKDGSEKIRQAVENARQLKELCKNTPGFGEEMLPIDYEMILRFID